MSVLAAVMRAVSNLAQDIWHHECAEHEHFQNDHDDHDFN